MKVERYKNVEISDKICDYLFRESGKCIVCEQFFNENKSAHLNIKHGQVIAQIMGSCVLLERVTLNSVPKLKFEMNNRENENDKNKVTNQNFKCRFCKIQIYAKMNLLNHEPLCEIIGKYVKSRKCLICNVYLNGSARIHFQKAHIKLFDSKDRHILLAKSSGQCKYCERHVNRRLKTHESTCAKLLEVLAKTTCLICNTTFKIRSRAISHVRTAHLEKTRKSIEFLKEQIKDTLKPIKIPLNGFDGKNCNMTFKTHRYKAAHESFCGKLDDKSPLKTISIGDNESKEEQSEFDVLELNPEPSEETDNVIVDMEKPPTDYETVEKDPFAVEKFVKCPICKSIFAFYEHFRRHIEKFHRIPMFEFKCLDLKVEEYSVSVFT